MAKRNVAVAIGIGRANPLPFLRGALNGATQFHQWAAALGYQSRLITDQANPVTLATLRAELEQLLSGDEIHRVLLYFAGHGMMRGAAESLWLLSDWFTEEKAVHVDGLRRKIQDYGVEQIAIFADACRSLPDNIRLADLTADKVLGRGPKPNARVPAVDKFVATQEGTQTFSLPGPRPDDARCLFTGVLLQGLWAVRQEAVSTLVPGRVTSSSLGDFLRNEVPAIAGRYEWEVEPDVAWSFPDQDNIYFGNFNGPAPLPPSFPAWPDPATVAAAMGPAPRRSARPAAPAAAPPGAERGAPVPTLQVRLETQPRPETVRTRSALAVSGAAVTAIWTRDDIQMVPEAGALTFASAAGVLTDSAPVLLELSDGLFAALTAIPDFIGSVVCDGDGVAALVYHKVKERRLGDITAFTQTAVARMYANDLKPSDAMDFAMQLREGKHSAPVLGAISAYLYDALGDVDSIRQMAFYYAMNSEAIPYDVALMAQLYCYPQNGKLIANVPPVAARQPRTEKEKKHPGVFSATGDASSVVSGLWPWLSQGWVFLDDPTDVESRIVLPGIERLIGELTKSPFATLKPAGGKQLAQLAGLTRRRID